VHPPDVDNRTDYELHPQLIFGKDGEALLTLVKGTFVLPRGDDRLVIAEPELVRPIRFADEPWGDPVTTPAKYPAEVGGAKRGSDVVVVAKGHAPEGRAVPSFDVSVHVGNLQKSLRIHGLRVWQANGSGLSAPRPLSEQEIRYDSAWGGLDASELTHIAEEPRNPTGRGVVRDAATLTHQPAPCIEDPAHPIKSASASNVVAGFGAIGPSWQPRRGFTGTYDASWQRERAPLLPGDFDERANQCATPDLVADPPLVGGERVALYNLTPGGGAVETTLPVVGLEVSFERKGGGPLESHRPALDMVLIDTLEVPEGCVAVVELLWRVVTRAPRRMKDLTIVVDEGMS
jgi:hypothetical protein